MLTLEEKKYLLQLLKKKRRWAIWGKTPAIHRKLIEKLEQMIRNETVNLQ
ncbi:MAG TPA: hypothetical protein VF260_00840 [Bacilli bacterium]